MLLIDTTNFFSPLLRVCVLLMAAAVAHGQYQVRSWTTDDDLPQNTVHSLLQTRDGYLWLTTLDGLVRFDGADFRVFNKQNTAGINGNRFTSLEEDAAGNLWIGTEDGTVVRHRGGVFQTFAIADDVFGFPVWRLELDTTGSLVVFTREGIIRWNGEQFAPHETIAGETANSVVLWSKTGAFWYTDGQIVYRFKDDQTRRYDLPGATGIISLNRFLEDSRGRIWIGTVAHGLFVLENEVWRNYSTRNGFPDNHVSPRLEDRDGNVWVATNQGAAIIGADGQIGRVTVADGLSDNVLSDIIQDREGNIWIGSLYRGLNLVSRQSVRFYTTKDGLQADIAHPIFEDREGRIWIGGKNLTLWENGEFHPVAGRNFSEVTAINQDRYGRMWFGHWQGVYFLENGVFTDFTSRLGRREIVTDIHEDRGGALWLASGGGLFRWQNDEMTRLTVAEGLPSNDVKVILESRDGSLWVGTYGGIARLEEGRRGEEEKRSEAEKRMLDETGSVSSSPSLLFSSSVFTTADGLASNQVRSLYEDADGVLWIGSYDGGLTRLKNGGLRRITSADGLFTDGVFQILEDERGWFWMSSNRGVYRVAKQQLNDFADGRIGRVESIAYGKSDGLLETECNGGQQPAGIRAGDGRLWFPTQRGVAVIDPREISFNSIPPPVVIESVKIDNVLSELSAAAERVARIQISPNQNNLEIAYSGLSFVKPEFIKFRYRLEGQDADWVEADNRRTAYYSYLPPGDYTFQVIAANSDGVWNMQGASVGVVVSPPFYRTWWFLILSLAALGGTVILFYQRRVAHFERDKAVQQAFSRQLIENQEQERKRIAAELHDGLGQSLVIIKNRAVVGLNEPENHSRLLSQMEEISASASAAITEVRGIARNLHPYQIDYLGLTTALETMINSVADATSIKFSAEIDAVDNVLSKESEVNLYRIVQEALNNVVKHSGASSALVALKKNGKILDLKIEDDGRGFTLDAENRKRGLGLTGIAERARMLNAEHEIQSADGAGTSIQLHINLGGSELPAAADG